MKTKIKIALGHSHELFRRAIIQLLSQHLTLEVSFEAATGKEVIEKLKQHHVEVVLLDTQILLMDGRTTLDIIHNRFPETRVIMLSGQPGIEQASEYMSRGASSYLSKDCTAEKLLCAIDAVKKEGYFFDESISKELLTALVKGKVVHENMANVSLNQRELDVAREVCEGKTNKEIAEILHLSPSTIDFYKTRIYGKVKCRNAVGLYKFLLKVGLASVT